MLVVSEGTPFARRLARRLATRRSRRLLNIVYHDGYHTDESAEEEPEGGGDDPRSLPYGDSFRFVLCGVLFDVLRRHSVFGGVGQYVQETREAGRCVFPLVIPYEYEYGSWFDARSVERLRTDTANGMATRGIELMYAWCA